MSDIRKNIEELPKQLADKIAAGEVVDRPLSIVKELLENSVDAGADSVIVEIKNGGKSYIRVTDNGSGIRHDETELAFKRHATSKLKSIQDLDAIGTLGFRGEALASIAAVSRVELITRTADENAGTSVVIEGGELATVSETGCPVGTTVIVRDLFYNTPARLKFLKKDNTESSLVIDFVSKMALAYPGIRVRLINNGNTLFSTLGRGDRFTAIATIFDPQTAKKLIKIDTRGDNGLLLEGYISSPQETRANRRSQIFFVNGRYIQSKLLENCVTEGYREKMFEGRHPVAFLFLSIDPEFIDVNIHPNKKEIRFDDENIVRDFVVYSIKEALKVPEAVPEIVFKKDRNGNKQVVAPTAPSDTNGRTTAKTSGQKQEQLDIRKLLREKRAAEEPAEYKPEAVVKMDISGQRRTTDNGSLFIPVIDKASSRPFEVADIKPVGIIFATYILGCDENNFYMIDQHAAHERVFYEKLTREFYGQQTASQVLAVPINIEVSHVVKNAEGEWLDFVKNTGFLIEEFGPRTYAIKEFPMYMDYNEAESFLKDFFDSLEEPGAFRDRKRAEKIIMRACKSAVKANDSLDMAEVKQLLNDLAKTDNPFSCPHGRPTFIRMTKQEISALFKR